MRNLDEALWEFEAALQRQNALLREDFEDYELRKRKAKERLIKFFSYKEDQHA